MSTEVRVMCALPPKADIAEGDQHVRFAPKVDIAYGPLQSRAAKREVRPRLPITSPQPIAAGTEKARQKLLAGAQRPLADSIEIKIHDRGRIKGEQLTDQKSANDGDAKRPANFTAIAEAQRQGHGAEKGGARGHHDRPKAQAAGLVNR